jgi:hypothetical protein
MAGAAKPDPIFAALERCRRMEAACDEAAAAQQHWNDDIAEEAEEALAARMALAQTVPTTWAGLAALISFASEHTAARDGEFYFEDSEAAQFIISIDQAITQLNRAEQL